MVLSTIYETYDTRRNEMAFTLLKGRFKPAAGIPDGDSVRFAPTDPSPLFTLRRQGRTPRVNQNNGTVQLRFEGIDALEKEAKEPFASDATSKNLDLLGLFSPTDESDGYILANQIGPNGRPICFVFAGDTDDSDGSSIFLDVERMKLSVNFQLINAGVVYPLFYDTLYGDLRSALASAAVSARESKLGIWPDDKTTTGVTWAGVSSLPNLDPIFPKLWRRLEKYTQNRDFRDESDTLDAFIDFLQATRDRLFILSESRFTDLDNIVVVNGDNVSLPFLPEDLVFVS
jgi:endonuclease YncB( thermonuclease family)